MCAYPRIARAALRFAAAGWAAVALSGCSSIDADRASFVFPQAIAAKTAARTQLSLVHNQTLQGLNVSAAAAPRPAASRGTFHEAYQRWLRGEVRELAPPGQTSPEAGN